MSKATSGPGSPQRAHSSSSGVIPFGGEQLPVERGNDQRAGSPGDGAQRADEHSIEVWRRLALQGKLVDCFEHCHSVGEVVEIGDQRCERLDRVGLTDDVEVAVPVSEQQLHVAHRLESRTELRHRLAHALGDGADLAVVFGHQHDDPIGFAEPIGAQHHRVVAIDRRAHQSRPPNRR
jgi:hypothetical protein